MTLAICDARIDEARGVRKNGGQNVGALACQVIHVQIYKSPIATSQFFKAFPHGLGACEEKENLRSGPRWFSVAGKLMQT
jgi:hypothetical protein